MNDLDTKCRLSVHLILGAGEYAKLKTESAPKMTSQYQEIIEDQRKADIIKRAEEPCTGVHSKILHSTQTSCARHSRIDKVTSSV